MAVRSRPRRLLVLFLAFSALVVGGAVRIVQDQCGPFTDVTPAICPYVLEIYTLGITAGTSATTYSPDNPVTRGQAAVFLSKGVNQTLARSSRRAALRQWWTTTPHWDLGLGTTDLGPNPGGVAADGSDLWVGSGPSVYRVRGSDGRLLETWTGSQSSNGGTLAAMGRVFVTGLNGTPDFVGSLDMIDPSQPAGSTTRLVDNVGLAPTGIAFDGGRLWIANSGLFAAASGNLAVVTPAASPPWSAGSVSVPCGFIRCYPSDVLFDGHNIWALVSGSLNKLDLDGNVLLTVGQSWGPRMAFDGFNIWVAISGSDSLAIVRADTGIIVTILSGNGVIGPRSFAFDGERVLVLNQTGVSLWRAADLSPLGSADLGSISPVAAASDGISFWVSLSSGQLARF